MKRTVGLIIAALAAAAVFAGLVHAVLVAAHVSEPAASTVYVVTLRRVWASAGDVLGLVAVVIGGLALYRAARRIGNHGRRGAILALILGTIGAVNGGLVLTFATGGPGSGNGVVGGAAAVVLGLIAIVLGSVVVTRSRRVALASGRIT